MITIREMNVLCVYLSRQAQEAWGGPETDMGTVALPSPETSQGSE